MLKPFTDIEAEDPKLWESYTDCQDLNSVFQIPFYFIHDIFVFLLPVTKLQTYKTVHWIDLEAALLGVDITPVVILMVFYWMLA